MKTKNKLFILPLALACALAPTCLSATAEGADANAPEQEQPKLYLVAGGYNDPVSGERAQYAVSGDSVVKLTDEQCAAIHSENAYVFGGKAGDALPAPDTERDGFAFNGWWGIEDATVTYYKTAPALTEDTYLYADYRAELSQHREPVAPGDDVAQEYPHYMEVTRAATGKTEKIQLFVSGTDVPNAVQAGYGGPVQFYNEWFQLSEGDDIKFYVSNVYGRQPTLAPQKRSNAQKITLEISGAGNTDKNTSATLKCLINGEMPQIPFAGDYGSSEYGDPMVRCVRKGTNNYRVYIKFYDDGGTMTIYMERMSAVE